MTAPILDEMKFYVIVPAAATNMSLIQRHIEVQRDIRRLTLILLERLLLQEVTLTPGVARSVSRSRLWAIMMPVYISHQ